MVDGAQGVVHGRHDVQQLGCDFYVFSSHKLYGPEGVGVLYGRPQALEQLRHWQFGGEMVQLADYQSASFRPAPLGFEAGTPPIAGVIGLGATLDYLASLDATAVAHHETSLHHSLLRGLGDREGIRILGTPQAALVSFVVEGVHNADIAHLLTEQGIAVRAGHHCAMPLLKGLGLEGRFACPWPCTTTATTCSGSSMPWIKAWSCCDEPAYRRQPGAGALRTGPGLGAAGAVTDAMGRSPEPLTETQQTDEHRVHGCESLVWLVAEHVDGQWHFKASSDARLLRGLLALLLVRVQGLPSAELAQVDLRGWFTQLGLERQLSPSRSNGLHAVLQRMAELAGRR